MKCRLLSAAVALACCTYPIVTPVASAASTSASSHAGEWVESIGPAAETLSSDLAEKCDSPPPGLGLDPATQAARSSKVIGGFNNIFRPCVKYELAHYTMRQLALVMGIALAVGLAAAWMAPNSPLQEALRNAQALI